MLGELKQRFRLFVRDIDRGENIIVINTDEGHATGIAYVIDKLERDEIIGSLAGQNTIMVITRGSADAETILDELEGLLE